MGSIIATHPRFPWHFSLAKRNKIMISYRTLLTAIPHLTTTPYLKPLTSYCYFKPFPAGPALQLPAEAAAVHEPQLQGVSVSGPSFKVRSSAKQQLQCSQSFGWSMQGQCQMLC
jgi:hypothetical protein